MNENVSLDASAYRAIGYAFRVLSDVPEVVRLVPRLLADLRATDEGVHTYVLTRETGPRPFVISVDGRVIRAVMSGLALIDELLWHVNREAIVGASSHIAIHAAAAVWRGHGLLFPASAGSGKTTLVAGLLEAGAYYATDEAALIAPQTAEFSAYPKPMWMSPASARAIRGLPDRLLPEYRNLSRVRVYVRPQDVRSKALSGSHQVRSVITPKYHPGGPTVLQPISRASGLLAISRNTFDLPRHGIEGILALSRVVEGARCYSLRIGDLSEAVQALDRLVSDRAEDPRAGLRKPAPSFASL
jgi:hypothetical protein